MTSIVEKSTENGSLDDSSDGRYGASDTVEKGGCGRLYEKVMSFFTGDSFVGAVFNLSNATIGAGVLFLPNVIRETGVIVGLLLLGGGGCLASITLYLLHKSYEKVTEKDSTLKDYEEIAYLCYGPAMSFFVQINIFILNFGACISYTVVVGDVVRGWFPDPVLHALILFIVMLPFVILSMSPKVANLRFVSYFSITCILLFVFSVVIFYFLGFTTELRSGPVEYVKDFTIWGNWLHLFSVLGVVTFSFACHTNLCPIESEFKERNRYKIGISIFLSILVDYGLFATIACFGYLSFCENTMSDIISSYKGGGFAPSFLRVLLAMSICATYPMASYPARYSFNNLINDVVKLCKGCWTKKKEKDDDDDDLFPKTPSINAKMRLRKNNDDEKSEKIILLGNEGKRTKVETGSLKENETKKGIGAKIGSYVKECFSVQTIWDNFWIIVTTLVMFFVSYLFALFYPYAANLFGLVGSTSSTCCSYVFPALFYLKLHTLKWYDWRKIAVIGVMIFGIIFGIWVTGTSLWKMITEGH